ncbi:MAG: alternate F1F0 ATPase, F1 subunit alpha [Phototrophicaceae bacterium]
MSDGIRDNTRAHSRQAAPENVLTGLLDQTRAAFNQALKRDRDVLYAREAGRVIEVGDGIARVAGLPGAQAEELIAFPGGLLGLAFNLDPDAIGVIMLGETSQIQAGDVARRTGRVADVLVGEGVLGRVIDPAGRPLDGGDPIPVEARRELEQPAPGMMDRAPVSIPLQTGIKSIDALIPIGRGQRELIVGDRQTGKTAIALDTIINQRDKDVICVYCAIGQKKSTVARFLADLRNYGAIGYTAVIAAFGENAPGLQYIAPYAATSIAEYFMHQGRDVLIVYDDLTKHARAYRELSLLLRRPPGREAYPGDIFYIHSRLLERSTQLNEASGGGSLTALPIVETQAQNISAYIPTNLISITDGQLYLSPVLFQKGVLPPVDIGGSVSRVGGKAQLPAYRAASGDLRLAYSQFEELEAFARFGTRLDEETRKTIERGRRVREVLKQPQYQPLPVPEQIAIMIAVTEGVFDELSLSEVAEAEQRIRHAVYRHMGEISRRILAGEKLSEADQNELLRLVRGAVRNTDEAENEAQQEMEQHRGNA